MSGVSSGLRSSNGRSRLNASTLNDVKGQTLANAAFVAVGVVETSFTIRLYSSAAELGKH